MLKLTLEDFGGVYSVETKDPDDTIQPVMDAFLHLLLAAGYDLELIEKYIHTEVAP